MRRSWGAGWGAGRGAGWGRWQPDGRGVGSRRGWASAGDGRAGRWRLWSPRPDRSSRSVRSVRSVWLGRAVRGVRTPAGLLIGLALASVGLARPAGAAAPTPTWRWPLTGPPAVVRGFDPPATAYGVGHRGVDLRGAPGALVGAAGAGRVSYAGLLAGRGVVVVEHGALRTTYEPVTARVRVGQVVGAGQLLGELGAGHCAPACLHWGLLRGSTYLDPLLLLGPTRVRLLPVREGAGPAPDGPARTGPGQRAGTLGAGTAADGRAGPGVPSTATPAGELHPALRGHDRPLGAAAAVALVAGLALLIRRPGPRPPSAPMPAAGRAGAPSPAPAVLEPARVGPVDLGSERARRRPG